VKVASNVKAAATATVDSNERVEVAVVVMASSVKVAEVAVMASNVKAAVIPAVAADPEADLKPHVAVVSSAREISDAKEAVGNKAINHKEISLKAMHQKVSKGFVTMSRAKLKG
jgi:hypothetical protein